MLIAILNSVKERTTILNSETKILLIYGTYKIKKLIIKVREYVTSLKMYPMGCKYIESKRLRNDNKVRYVHQGPETLYRRPIQILMATATHRACC